MLDAHRDFGNIDFCSFGERLSGKLQYFRAKERRCFLSK